MFSSDTDAGDDYCDDNHVDFGNKDDDGNDDDYVGGGDDAGGGGDGLWRTVGSLLALIIPEMARRRKTHQVQSFQFSGW